MAAAAKGSHTSAPSASSAVTSARSGPGGQGVREAVAVREIECWFRHGAVLSVRARPGAFQNVAPGMGGVAVGVRFHVKHWPSKTPAVAPTWTHVSCLPSSLQDALRRETAERKTRQPRRPSSTVSSRLAGKSACPFPTIGLCLVDNLVEERVEQIPIGISGHQKADDVGVFRLPRSRYSHARSHIASVNRPRPGSGSAAQASRACLLQVSLLMAFRPADPDLAHAHPSGNRA